MVRSDNSMNFFSGESKTPKFSISATSIIAPGPDAFTPSVNVSTQSIGYLTGLTQNVQEFINALQNNSNTNLKVADVNASNSTLSGNLNVGRQLVVGGNADFRQNILVEGNAEILGDEYVHKALVVGGNCTIDGSLIVKGDVSMGDYHFAGHTISAYHDVSVGGNIDASTNLNFYDAKNAVRATINAQFITVPNVGGNAFVSVDLSSISALHGLTTNVQDFITASTGGTGTQSLNQLTVKDQTVTGNVVIGNTLLVGGNATFKQDVLVGGNLDVDGNFNVLGDEYVGKSLIVGGNTTIDGSLTVKGDVSMGDYKISGHTISAISDVSFNKKLNVGGKLQVGMDASFQQNVQVTGHLSVGSLSIGDSAASDNKITFNQKFHVIADVSLDSALAVGDSADIGGALTVTGASTLAGLTAGNTQINGTLGVTGLSTLVNTQVNGTLDVTGKSTLVATQINSTLDVTGKSTLVATQINSTLDVTGATTLVGTTVNGALTVTGDYSSLLGNLTLTAGKAEAYDVTAHNDLKAGNMTFNTHYQAPGGPSNSALIQTSTSNMYLKTADNGLVTIGNDLKVTGNVSFTGSYTQVDTLIEATKMLDISNNGTGVTVQVGQKALTTDIAYFMQDTFPVMKILKQHQIVIGADAAVSNDYMLDVAGNVNLRNKLNVTQASTFGADVTITSSKLNVGSDLTVTGASTFKSAVTAENNATIGGTLVVTGAVTFGNTVTLSSGILTVKEFNAQQDATFNGNVTLDTGKLTIKNFEAQNAAVFDDNIYMGVSNYMAANASDGYDEFYSGSSQQAGFLIQFV